MDRLISIITLTYNYGHLIHRLFDSVLQQTYTNIEMIVIDDGSTDKTKQIIEEYTNKFNKKKYKFCYFYQENQKQAVAMNNGLKLITGDYLVWPDADNWYAKPDALEIMATALDDTDDEISCCRSLAYLVDENFNVMGKTRHHSPEQLFKDCLLARKFKFAPGFTMVKTHILFDKIDNRTIYTGKNFYGQNWQIYLPIFYNHKCIMIDECLFNIFVHTNSDSHKKYSYERQLEKTRIIYDAREAILHSIKDMPNEERKDLIYEIKVQHDMRELLIHFYFGENKNVKHVYRQMIANNIVIPIEMTFYYYLSFIPFGYIVYYKIIYKIIHVCEKIKKLFFAGSGKL